MATTRFVYVRNYELPDPILPNTYFVVRLDGQSFHRFSDLHGFQKPNDLRALQLMDRAAQDVLRTSGDIVLGFGESDEYSLLFRRSCTLFNRRQSKILSTVVSQFTSSYVFHWPELFPTTPLQYPPTFDGRLVVYPSEREVRDYFAWRQADTHINNLYNTTFWALIQNAGMSTSEAHTKLKGTVSADKHELLHSQFEINYNTLPERYRKGSVLVRDVVAMPRVEPASLPERVDSLPEVTPEDEEVEGSNDRDAVPADPTADRIARQRQKKADKKAAKLAKKSETTAIVVLHCDIIDDTFWIERPELLS